MENLEKDIKLNKTPESLEEQETDQHKIAGNPDRYPEKGGFSMQEAVKQEGAKEIAKLQTEIKDKFPPSPEISEKPLEFPPNTPDVFQKMPEIAPYVTAYMDDYNKRMNVGRFKKMLSIFSYDSEELKKFELAGKKALGLQYRDVLNGDGKTQNPEAAWNYVKGFIYGKYRGIDKKTHEVTDKGRFRVAMGEDSALKGE